MVANASSLSDAKRNIATNPGPVNKTLNDLLVSSEGLKTKLKQLYETAPMASTVKGYKGANRKRETATCTCIKKLGKDYSPSAVCLLHVGFTCSHMLRASTLGRGLKHNDHQEDPLDRGIQADMVHVITEPDGSTTAGISYTIQFLKDWDYGVTSHQGEKLPLSSLRRHRHPTFRARHTAQFPLRLQNGGQQEEDRLHPQPHHGSHFLRAPAQAPGLDQLQNADGSSSPEARQLAEQADMGNPRGHLHEDRQPQLPQDRIGVSLALASGISIPNLTNWCHWKSEDMPWHYADQKYVAPPLWKEVFHWMKQRPAQALGGCWTRVYASMELI